MSNNQNKFCEMPDSFHSTVLNTLDNLDNSQKKKTVKFQKSIKVTLLAAAIVVVLCSSVFAGNKIYQNWLIKNGKYQLQITSDENAEAPVSTAPEYAAVKLNYLPDGLVQSDDYAKYHFKGNEYKGGLSLILYRLSDVQGMKISSVQKYEECTFGSHKGMIIYNDVDDIFNRTIYIYYNDIGCLLQCFVGSDVTATEMVKIAEGIEITATTKDNAFGYETNIPGGENSVSEVSTDDAQQIKEIVKFGDAVKGYVCNYSSKNSTAYDIVVKDVKVTDNISGFDKSSFNSSIGSVADEKGNVLSYDKKTYAYGDGINSVDTLISSEKVNRRFLTVTLDVKNTNNKAGYFYSSLYNGYFTNGTMDYNIESQLAYIGGQDGDAGDFYFVKMKENEEKLITLGYLIDEDVNVNELYMSFNNWNEAGNSVTIAALNK